MNIKNISIQEINVLKNKKLLKNSLEYINYYKKNVDNNILKMEELLPNTIKHHVTFELTNTIPEFANMIRRVLEDEVSVYSFTFDLNDFISDDIYILHDIIKQRLEALPISQDINKLDLNNLEIKLHFGNPTNKKIDILSKYITIYDKKKKAYLDTSKLYDQNIVLYGDSTYVLSPETKTYLGEYSLLYKYAYNGLKHMKKNTDIHISKYFLKNNSLPNSEIILDELNFKLIPDRNHLLSYKEYNIGLDVGKLVKINNIKIIKGKAYKNSNAFPLVSNISYEILDIKPFEKNKNNNSSLNSTPTHFKLGFKTYGNIKPKLVMIKVFKNIIKRLNKILKELMLIKKIPYYSNNIKIEKIDQITVITINHEYRTLSSVISRYIYILEPNIKYISPSIIHPDINKSLIKIKHNNCVKISIEAIKKILNDVEKIKKIFE